MAHHIIVYLITVLLFIPLVLVAVYAAWFLSLVTHEGGHWLVRRHYGIRTTVFIGLSKRRYYPLFRDWYWSPKLFGGVNYPASVLTVKDHPGVPVILLAGSIAHLLGTAFLYLLYRYIPTPNPAAAEVAKIFLFAYGFFAIGGIATNLLPFSMSQGAVTFSLQTLAKWARESRPLSINDAMWIRVWAQLRKNPSALDDYKESETFTEMKEIFEKYANLRK